MHILRFRNILPDGVLIYLLRATEVCLVDPGSIQEQNGVLGILGEIIFANIPAAWYNVLLTKS